MTCRICGSPEDASLGTFQPYLDYECEVRACGACGCRFAPHDDSVYERLHSADESTYAFHEAAALRCRELYNRADVGGLRAYLSRTRKNAFITSAVESLSETRKLLELGCSKGYLTSYFLAAGYDVLGVDVSESAVKQARDSFGDHFVTSGSEKIGEGKPYDAIYHAGMIGCVKSPIEMTRDLLNLLRPGGALIFNAPNANACAEIDQLWVNGTSPPDLVTLFKPEFWSSQFGDLAEVQVIAEPANPTVRFRVALKNVMRLHWKYGPKGTHFGDNSEPTPTNAAPSGSPALRFALAARPVLEPVLRLLAAVLFVPKYASDFGMFVIMKKK